jgi:hypothetical protein
MEQIQTTTTPNFETVWAILQENALQMKEMRENQKESRNDFYHQMQESKKDFDLRLQETDRIIKNIGKRLGDFTNSFGDVVEYLISSNLQEKFREFGYDFQEASTKYKIRDKKNDIRFEIDVFLQDGDTAMLVEIKANLTISDINEHITRLEKMRRYADLRGDKRHFLGAVAGIVVDDKEREYALSQGFFLIEPTGENFNITPPDSKPKKW